MTELTEVRVPDIGDFSDIPVIEIPGRGRGSDPPEDPLVTLESDKATMDVPAPAGGVVRDVAVAVGDNVSEGSVLLKIALDGADSGEEQEDESSSGSRGVTETPGEAPAQDEGAAAAGDAPAPGGTADAASAEMTPTSLAGAAAPPSTAGPTDTVPPADGPETASRYRTRARREADRPRPHRSRRNLRRFPVTRHARDAALRPRARGRSGQGQGNRAQGPGAARGHQRVREERPVRTGRTGRPVRRRRGG